MSQRGPIGVNDGTSNGASSGTHNGANSGHAEQPAEASAQAGQDEYAESPRKPKTERENAFDASAWLIQGLIGLGEELRHSDLGLPEDFWVHAYAARKEALLAARVLVDTALEKCASEEAAQSAPKKKPPQRGQVSINFD